MPVVRTSDEWLGSSRWMAAVHPATALRLFRPILTQQPSPSPLHHGCVELCALSRPRRVVHACRTARGGELCESRRDARATMARCRVEWPYGAHGESLQEACGSGHRCSPRPPPGKPSTIPCTPELVPSVGPSGTAWGSRGGFRSTRYCLLHNERLRLKYTLTQRAFCNI